MGKTARITVTSGPDRGKVFQLNEELVHIGSGGGNQIALSDQLVAEHQASIVSRDGRYAIYTPLEQAVKVDGNTIPVQRWVWLPASANITVSERTSVQFDEVDGDAPSAAAKSPVKPTPAAKEKKSRAGQPKRAAAKRRRSREQKEPSVARFITDQQGDTLVKLGEDGHLPDLHLVEGESRKTVEKTRKPSSPVVLYVVLGVSVVATMMMLLMDFEPAGSTQEERARARELISHFYGGDNENLQPYQVLLREAQLAHSRGDVDAERQSYREVLRLLNAEDVQQSFSGLTGDRGSDDVLADDDDRLLEELERSRDDWTSDQVLKRLIGIVMRR